MVHARVIEALSQREEGRLVVQIPVEGLSEDQAALATLVNAWSQEIQAHLDQVHRTQEKRTKELMDAYNAIQGQRDEFNKELTMARAIQQRMLPQASELPQRPEVAVAGWYASMGNVGGDYYDVIRLGRNVYAILMADVSGHGVPSALVKISFRVKSRLGVDPQVICAEVNQELCPIISELDYFVTAFFGVLDLEQGSFRYCNCGHHPALVLPSNGGVLGTLDAKGRFLGVFDDAQWESRTVTLSEGDTVCLVTDGLVESRDLLGEEYGYDRLHRCLLRNAGQDPGALVEAVKRDVGSFSMGAEAHDDLSLLIFRFNEVVLSENPEERVPVADTARQPRDPAQRLEVLTLRDRLRQTLAERNWRQALETFKTLDASLTLDMVDVLKLGILALRCQDVALARQCLARCEESTDPAPMRQQEIDFYLRLKNALASGKGT